MGSAARADCSTEMPEAEILRRLSALNLGRLLGRMPPWLPSARHQACEPQSYQGQAGRLGDRFGGQETTNLAARVM